MFGLETLDVLIGLATLYLIFGIACTAIVEAFMSWLNIRSNNLDAALKEFLAGELKQGVPFAAAFCNHPLTQTLSQGDAKPSYIPPEIVGRVVEALISGDPASTLEQSVDALPGTPQTNRIKGILEIFAKQAAGDITVFRKAIETHFDASMDRASGCVKRSSHSIGLIVSTALVIGANVDSIDIASSLASNPEARMKIVAIAQQQLDAVPPPVNTVNSPDDTQQTTGNNGIEKALTQTREAISIFNKNVADMSAAELKLGWKNYPNNGSEWFTKIVGLLVSIAAISLGAPFWFDTLQRMMQVRTSGVSPREKKQG